MFHDPVHLRSESLLETSDGLAQAVRQMRSEVLKKQLVLALEFPEIRAIDLNTMVC